MEKRLPDWHLSGWTPEAWRLQVSMELGLSSTPEVAPLPCTVPSSVQKVLHQAGWLPDWNAGLNSRACEWVENRHWMYSTYLPPVEPGEKVRLLFSGLDGRCEIWLNEKPIAAVDNAFVPHEFEIGEYLSKELNRLRVIFLSPPRWLGQTSFTSLIRDWKPRFNYTWDWIPRLVQIGIFGDVRLEIGDPSPLKRVLKTLNWLASFDPSKGTGGLHFQRDDEGPSLSIRLLDGEETIVCCTMPAKAKHYDWTALPVRPWEPNGNGKPKCYRLEISLGMETETVTVGFKRVEWLPCAGAPQEADPWLCRINGVDTFLQGINWTPIRPNFADLKREDYELRLRQYHQMGINCIRVWGGGFSEHDWLYEECDALGILVWQDFPLSSSGLDNWPPEEQAVIDDMECIARYYVSRLRRHPSVFLWCGGNELQGALDGGKIGIGKLVDVTHPLIARLAQVVRELDPQHRFVATSASGPRFVAAFEDFGKGLHWDVHGPWLSDAVGVQPWEKYWQKDDALFRSEMGHPGAQPLDLFEHYQGDLDPSQPGVENPYWQRFGWWYNLDTFLKDRGNVHWTPEDYISWSQAEQADKLGKAVAACKARFPTCGGLLIWMGHDSFPAAINTSLLDFFGRPKPVVKCLERIFRNQAEDRGT